MVVATLLWGGTFVILRDTVPHIAPGQLVFARFVAASAVYMALLAARGRVPRGAALLGGAVSGFLAACGYLFQAIGITATSAGSSAFLTCAGTLFAAVFAWPLLGQRPGRVLAFGLVLAIAGSALLTLREGLRPGEGEAWTLAGALIFALQVVAVGRWAPRADPIAFTAVQTFAMALTMAPFAGGTPGRLGGLDAAGWWRLGYLVAAASVVAPLLQVSAQRVLPPGRIGLLFALEPVFALAFAVTFGMERFEARWWLGAALILLAVIGVEGHSARRTEAPRPASAGNG